MTNPASPSAEVVSVLVPLLSRNLPECKFAFKAIQNWDSNTQLAGLHRIFVALWDDNYADFYKSAVESVGFKWDALIQPYIDRLVSEFRSDTLDLLAKSFSTLKPDSAARFLGLSGNIEAAIQTCLSRGWELNESTFLVPPPTPILPEYTDSSQIDKNLIQGADEASLELLTRFVVELEKP